MWRLLVLALVGPVWAEGDLEEEDAGYLERRLDDLGGLDAVAVRWRVRGAEAARERWQLYQRVEVAPVSGQAFFGLVERDPGESGWSDFRTFYYAVQKQRSEWIVGDLRPGTGAGLVFGRNRRGTIAPRMPAGDSRRLGYRSSGENHALRGAAWRYEGQGVEWDGARGLGASGWALGRAGAGAVAAGKRLSRDCDRGGWPRPAGHSALAAVGCTGAASIGSGARPCWPWTFPTASICGGMGGRLGGLSATSSAWGLWMCAWSGIGDVRRWRWLAMGWGTGGWLGNCERGIGGLRMQDVGPLLCAGIPQLLWRGSGDFGHAERTGWRR